MKSKNWQVYTPFVLVGKGTARNIDAEIRYLDTANTICICVRTMEKSKQEEKKERKKNSGGTKRVNK